MATQTPETTQAAQPGESTAAIAATDEQLAVSGDVNVLFNKYAEKYDTDVLFLNGPINDAAIRLATVLDRQERHKNVLLLLVTQGGNPHTAYRLARALQRVYQKFTLFVTGECKSAGTLVALGAQELVFGELGELGPLDMQMVKKDDPMAQESGTTTLTTLRILTCEAVDAIKKEVRKLRLQTGGSITLPTATSFMTDLIQGLYQPILAQLDPVHLGEMQRALRIAEEYGYRLLEISGNISPENLEKLVSGYPSHAFVIDEPEARKLFKQIRQLNALEQMIILALGESAILPQDLPMTKANGLLYLNQQPNGKPFLPRENIHMQMQTNRQEEPPDVLPTELEDESIY